MDYDLWYNKSNSRHVSNVWKAAVEDVCFELGMSEEQWNSVGQKMFEVAWSSGKKRLAGSRWTINQTWVKKILAATDYDINKTVNKSNFIRALARVDFTSVDENPQVDLTKFKSFSLSFLIFSFPGINSPLLTVVQVAAFCRDRTIGLFVIRN